VALDPSGGCVI
jgi:hypothetical protein